MHAGMISVTFGAQLGHIFEFKALANRRFVANSPWIWHQTSFVKTILRCAITYGVMYGLVKGLDLVLI
jgi:hypothetical protein